MSQKYSHHKTLKKAVTVIASEFFTFFADQVQEKSGIRPNEDSIVIQSIDIKRNVGRRRELYLVDIPFSSDAGVYETRLFIKLFKDHSKVFQEASGSMNLEEVLKPFDQIKTPQLLYFSSDWNILVYEGIYAEDYDTFTYLTDEEKLIISGQTLAKIHGTTLKDVDLQRYYLLLEKTLKKIRSRIEYYLPDHLSTLDECQERLITEIENHLFYAYSGAISFGDFHTGNIMFEIANYRRSSLSDKFNNIVVWLIDPEFFDIESTNHDKIDRMEDIAGIFTSQFLSEYSKTSKITNTKDKVKKFMYGYNKELKSSTGIELIDAYPKGHTLEYQISQSLLYDLLHYVSNQIDTELIKEGFLLRIRLINHLLNNRLDI